ncbi:MAG: hypothetical protein HY559_06970 [Gammaproteobacteria bacterium]|nr:hypothetical protein [Gammaproteobacteria bacterium]
MRNAIIVLSVLLVARMAFAFAQDRDLSKEQTANSQYSDAYMVVLKQADLQGTVQGMILVTIARSLVKTEQGSLITIVIRVQQKPEVFEVTPEHSTQEFFEAWFSDSLKVRSGMLVLQGEVGMLTLVVREGGEKITVAGKVTVLVPQAFEWDGGAYQKDGNPLPVSLNEESVAALSENFMRCFYLTFFSEMIQDSTGRSRWGYLGGAPRAVAAQMLGDIDAMLHRPISAYIQK